MTPKRILVAFCLFLVSSSLLANEQLLKQMYELADLSISVRSQEQHLKDINELLLQNPQDQHLQGLANILKASYYIFQEDFVKAQQFLTKAKPFKDTVQLEKLNREYDFAQVFLLRSDGQVDRAMELATKLYDEVIAIWPKHKLSHLVLEKAYLGLFQYKYGDSLDFLQVALNYSYESNDPYQIAATYNLFGIIYSELNDEISANKYYKKAVDLVEAYPKLGHKSYLLSNLADSYRELKDYEKAKEYLDKSEARARKEEDIPAIAFVHQIYSRLFVDQKKYQEALENLLIVADLSEQIGESLFGYDLHADLASIYLELDQVENAEKHLRLAEGYSEKLNETYLHYVSRLRANTFAKRKMYKKAYEALDKSYTNYRKYFNDSLTKVSSLAREQLDKAQLNFDNKLLAKENELHEKSVAASKSFNETLWFLIGLLLTAILVLFWFMYRYRNLANENQRLALTDNLTLMPNRRHIFRKLDIYHEKSETSDFAYSVILFDIDRFKNINDRFGHHIGDKVIQATKDICQIILRATDTIGRIGGEEFLIILPNTSNDNAYKIAERIREQFENYDFDALAQGLRVTSSFGVTQCLPADENLDHVINRADRLLYKAKNEGRNRVFAGLS